MVTAEDAHHLYQLFLTHGKKIWVTGGWGIDALLGEQTRSHKDLDIFMLVDDVVEMNDILNHEGYRLKEIWEENRWFVDRSGSRNATAYVLKDNAGHELDVHALHINAQGAGSPAWERDDGFIYTPQYLGGCGSIAGFLVHCMSPEYQVVSHKGYVLPDYQVRDLERLRDRFGLQIPILSKPGESTIEGSPS